MLGIPSLNETAHAGSRLASTFTCDYVPYALSHTRDRGDPKDQQDFLSDAIMVFETTDYHTAGPEGNENPIIVQGRVASKGGMDMSPYPSTAGMRYIPRSMREARQRRDGNPAQGLG